MSYGHALKTAGRQDGVHRGLSAQHRARAGSRRGLLEPRQPEDLPLHADADLAAMRAQLARADLAARGPLPLPVRARQGARGRGRLRRVLRALRRGQPAAPRGASRTTPTRPRRTCARSKALFTREFFAARAGYGLPRRRIRSSSSACRAPARRWSSRSSPATPRSRARWSCRTSSRMARELGGRKRRSRRLALPGGARDARAPSELRALGEHYLAQTRIQRKTGAPFFIDKMPNNFAHVGLHPPDPAEREDHRRAPPSDGLLLLRLQAAFRARPELHLQPRGHRPLLPRLRRADGALRRGAAGPRPPRASTSAWSTTPRPRCGGCSTTAACPSRRRCLRFYENERAVRTASSEQVRQPIFRDGLDQWRHYEPWLEPLQDALGPVLDAYPAAPEF